MKFLAIFLTTVFFKPALNQRINAGDAILGKWETVENNLIVEVYKAGLEYRAKLVWFKNSDYKTNPQENWRDVKNPDAKLRQRKILGMEVLQHLVYNPDENRWEEGSIYDSTTGRTWDSSAWISKDGFLNVHGFWHWEFFGKTIFFKKL